MRLANNNMYYQPFGLKAPSGRVEKIETYQRFR
jgi:hypothetical protein